nr:hypothetical protein [Halomonas olivaria]
MQQFAATVDKRVGVDGQAVAVAGQPPRGIVEGLHVEHEQIAAELHDIAADVGQFVRVEIKPLGHDPGLVGAQRARRPRAERLLRGEGGAAGIDPPRSRDDVDVPRLGMAVPQGNGISLGIDTTGSKVQTAGVNAMRRSEYQVAIRAQGPIIKHTCSREGVEITMQVAGRQLNVASRNHHSSVEISDLSLTGRNQIITGTHETMIRDIVVAGQSHVTLGGDLPPVGDASVGVDHDLTGRKCTSVMNAHSMFSGHKMDLASIHAAQMSHINGDRGDTSTTFYHRYCLSIGTDMVGAGNNIKVIGPNACLHLNSTGQDGSVIAVAGIQAIPRDTDGALLDPVTGQFPCAEFGAPGGQGGTAGIDEARAIDVDAGGVGDDDLCTLSGNFHVATQLAGVARVDLVDDHPRLAGGEIGIALHPAAELGLGGTT